MILTTSFRIIRYGLQSFLRNGWLSTATILVMVLAVCVFEGLIVFGVVAQQAIASIQDKIDISVYFKSQALEDEILRVKRSLESLAEVKNVNYFSREDALKQFRDKHAGDNVITQALDELNENPLLASLNIKAHNPKHYGSIASYLDGNSMANLVEKVTYTQNQVVIERLVNMIDISRRGWMILVAVLSLVAVTVTFNTIRLAIYSNREEIGIMRLVGASNNFVRGPYLVEGVLYGLVAGLIGFAVFVPLVSFASPYVGKFIPGSDLTAYFSQHWLPLLSYQFLFGISLGVVSSAFAIRRYLKV